MAGLSGRGLEIKRLQQVIDDRISSARNFFGSDAKVSVNDVLGRALRIHGASEADLWVLAEAVYNSFNPNIATGISLDRIVAYGGLSRFEAAPSVVQLLAEGDYNTTISENSYVDSSVTPNRFVTTSTVSLDRNDASGATVEVISAADNTTYTITIGASSFSHTTGTNESLADIANALRTNINGSTSDFTASVVNTTQVRIEFSDVFVRRTVTITANLSFQRIAKLVRAESEQLGEVSQPANTLDTIASPVSGWDSVTNPQKASLGRLRETDEELRVRFAQSKELNARGTIDSIFSSILEVIGVEQVQVYENETNGVDAQGLPAKSFSAVVLGGSSQEIAETIWRVKPAGIESFGNVTIGITDTQGLPHNVSFARPVEVQIYISVTISAAENQSFPSNVDELIIDSLEEYFEDKYGVGDDVIYSRLYTPINNASSGYQVDSLTIGTTANPTGTSNIVVAYNEIADLLRGNVTVTVN